MQMMGGDKVSNRVREDKSPHSPPHVSLASEGENKSPETAESAPSPIATLAKATAKAEDKVSNRVRKDKSPNPVGVRVKSKAETDSTTAAASLELDYSMTARAAVQHLAEESIRKTSWKTTADTHNILTVGVVVAFFLWLALMCQLHDTLKNQETIMRQQEKLAEALVLQAKAFGDVVVGAQPGWALSTGIAELMDAVRPIVASGLRFAAGTLAVLGGLGVCVIVRHSCRREP
jgi:hypothetical protein